MRKSKRLIQATNQSKKSARADLRNADSRNIAVTKFGHKYVSKSMSASKPKIGIQGWFAAEPFTGIGKHTIGLAKALAAHAEITVVAPKKISVDSMFNKNKRRTNYSPMTNFHIKIIKPKWVLGPLKKWYWEFIQVPQYFKTQKLDLEYYPYPCPIPRCSKHRRAMTVHDMIPWKDSRYKGGKLKTHYCKKSLYSLVYVDEIFTVSETVKKELGMPSAKILPNSAERSEAALRPRSGALSAKRSGAAFSDEAKAESALSRTKGASIVFGSRRRRALAGKNLIYLGGYDIRKNVPLLLKEFKNLNKQFPEMKLVLIGKAHHDSRYYPKLNLPPNVIQTGNISDKKVYELLHSAFAFVHFSDSEGFNIPLLQAMTAGCPAIVNDIPVNREISSNSAIFLNASQKGALTDKIKMLENPKVRAKIIKAQKAAASKFSWEKSAQILLKYTQK